MRFSKKGIAARKLGKPPGTIADYSSKTAGVTGKTFAEVFSYTANNFKETSADTIEEIIAITKKPDFAWINVFDLHDEKKLKRISEVFQIEKLTMEDILNPNHRPKLETFDNYIFIVLKMLSLDKNGKLESEQVSIVFNEKYVLVFQEKLGDVFGPIREQLRSASSKLRNYKPDYLALMLMDVIVDNYIYVLESLSDTMEVYEEKLIKFPEKFNGDLMHSFRVELSYIRKVSHPLREIATGLLRSKADFIKEDTMIYFRDFQDHVVNVIETIETLREMAKEVYDLYISKISLRTNEIMQTLTIISTIFIPLTFIAGVYGMNFENMPELKWGWGYLGIWGIMIVCAIMMVFFFKRKKWL